jgi:tetratricopeptide (TPR) repeat protein
MNYQIEYATLQALELIAKYFCAPLRKWELTLEPRDVGLFGVASWDLGIQPENIQMEVKINPSRDDVVEWLKTVRKGADLNAEATFSFVFGNRGTVLLVYVARLMRIAREANGDKGRFDSRVVVERVKEADFICSLLGENAHIILQRIDLAEMPEGHLSADIAVRARLLAGESGGEKLRTLLFDKFYHAVPHRQGFLIEELIAELSDNGIQLQPPANVDSSEYGQTVAPALLVLQNCTSPIPTQILSTVTAIPAADFAVTLNDAVEDGFLEFDDGLWSMRPIPVRLTLPNRTEVFAKALEALLRYIQNHQKEERGFRQVRNAITLARKCETTHPNVVAQVFLVLDKLLKRVGDKHLVLDVAEMSVSAARRADRRRAEADAEARALVCGVSWVYQRLPGHLREAKYAYDRSRELANIFDLQESLAYSTKCLGRLHRIMAEETKDKAHATEDLRLSVQRLKEAVTLFSNLEDHGPDKHEVGDSLSLLARTYMVDGQHELAKQTARRAYRILAGSASKEYIDLLILMGELEQHTDPPTALRYFTDALEIQTEFDVTVREMRARAYRQRGLLKNKLGDRAGAIADITSAFDIWQKLAEVDLAAEAEWNLLKLKQKVNEDDVSQLSEWPTKLRVIAVKRHLDTASLQTTNALARRAKRDRTYWKKLIDDAEREDALTNVEWQRLNDK